MQFFSTYLYKTEQFFHQTNWRFSDVSPRHIFTVHRQYESIERAVCYQDVFHQHEEISSAIHVVIHLRVRVFEMSIKKSLFSADIRFRY